MRRSEINLSDLSNPSYLVLTILSWQSCLGNLSDLVVFTVVLIKYALIMNTA